MATTWIPDIPSAAHPLWSCSLFALSSMPGELRKRQNWERKVKAIPASSVLSLADGKVKHIYVTAIRVSVLHWELSHCPLLGAAARSLGFVEVCSVPQSTPSIMVVRDRQNRGDLKYLLLNREIFGHFLIKSKRWEFNRGAREYLTPKEHPFSYTLRKAQNARLFAQTQPQWWQRRLEAAKCLNTKVRDCLQESADRNAPDSNPSGEVEPSGNSPSPSL